MQFLEAHSQIPSLLVLAFTAVAILWQAIASVRMAKSSLEQTKLMRMQIHESLRPVVTVAGGKYGPNSATLTLKNLGAGAALGIVGIYRGGGTQRVASLSANESTSFPFDNSRCNISDPIGPPEVVFKARSEASARPPLRLEYESVTGAKCWTTIKFKLGGEGEVEPDEIKHGMDAPSISAHL